MTTRPKLPLPFGGGVDRYTGSAVAEPSAFRDLRNVHLRRGGAELRGGLATAASLAGDAVIGVFPIRSQGIGGLVTYTSATREVTLHLTSADGSVTSLVGVVWTLPVDAGFPRVIGTEYNDRLVLAHDEPIFAKRQVTRVYDPTAGTIANLQADLYLPTDPPTNVDLFFRGVTTYLEYLVGWGYGSENPGDENAPEIVRFSKPAELVFLPEHYFIAGSRGDPVLWCGQAGDVLVPSKPSSRQQIFGYDRATFGIKPLDRFHGIAASRLSVTIGGIEYFWSLSGPRRSVGGLSEDLSLPLDLGGPTPSELATMGDVSYAFAAFDPDAKEVLFVFGRWAYVYHVGEPGDERWSFREYAAEVACAGVLYEASGSYGGGGGGGGIGSPAFPSIGVVTADAPGGGVDEVQLNVAYTTNGVLIGGEVVELWAKSRYAGDLWVRIATAAADAVGATLHANVGRFGITYDVAVRFTYIGIPSSGFTSGNPFDWPAGARSSVRTAIPVPSLDSFGIVQPWSRVSAVAHGFTLHRLTPPTPALHPELTSVLEHSLDGGGTWTPHAAQALSGTPAQLDLANALAGQNFRWRIKDVSSEGVASAYGVSFPGVDLWSGPLPLTAVSIEDPGTVAGEYHALWNWSAEAGDASFEAELVFEQTPGPHDDTDVRAWPIIDYFPVLPCLGLVDIAISGRTRRTQFGVTDYSAVLLGSSIPVNC